MTKKENYDKAGEFVSIADELRKTLPVTVKKSIKAIFGKNGKYITIGGKKESKEKTIILYLNEVGDLWREPKGKNCYLIGETSDRHKIVRYLAKNRGYQQTRQISFELGEKNEKSIMAGIYKINDRAKAKLNIKDNLIRGRKGSGYIINPKFRIILKDE